MTVSAFQGRIAVEPAASPHTFDSNSERWKFNRCTVRRTKELLTSPGITGNRSLPVDRSRMGVYRVEGDLEINPSYQFLDLWLPRICGADESSDTFEVADTLQPWGIRIDDVAKIVQYDDMLVNRAELRFAPGLLTLTLNVMGLAATETGLTFPAATFGTGDAYTMLAFHDAVFSLEPTSSGEGIVREGILTVDNLIEPMAAAGSASTQSLRPAGRNVTLTLTNGLTADDWDELYGTETPWDATITSTYENMTNVATVRNLMSPKETPVLNAKGDEVVLGLTFTAHSDASNSELTWTNDPNNAS